MMLIAVISVMLYYYIRVTVFETVIQELTHEANQIITNPQKIQSFKFAKFHRTRAKSNRNLSANKARPAYSEKALFLAISKWRAKLYHASASIYR